MTILDTPSGVAALSVQLFPTGILPKASTPLDGTEIVAIAQHGSDVYANITDFSAVLTGSITQSVQTQNLFDLTIGGNTAGVGQLVSSGTLSLAGGANVTLSQNGNAVTISAAAGGGGNFSAGVSTGGNTSGSTGLTGTQLVLAGGQSITLSQSTGPNGATITVSGASTSQSVQTQNLIDVTLAGNTAGALALVSSGTLTLAGGNNVTLSQAGNAVTVSAANQSVQTQNLVDVTISSNTAGVGALISSGTLTLAGGANITLSQNAGNAITIIGGAGGAGFSAGASNLGNTAGSTGVTGTRLVFVGTNAVSLSQSTDANGGTLSVNVTIPAQTVESQSIGASNLGNTLGTSGVASGGQVRAVIIGTSNITVSQSVNGASATLSLIGQPAFSAGASNLGNTAGSTGITGTRLVLVGTNAVSLSQSTDGNGGTVSVNVTIPAQTVESQSIGASNLGNTLGTSGVASGGQVRAVIIGTSNLTVSQSVNGASATLSLIANPPFVAGVSTGGNTAGATGVSSTQLVLVGSNNITLSQTTGAAGATVSIIGAAGGAGFSAGASNLGNTAGSTGITGTRLVLVGTNAVSLSQSTDANGGTVSINVTIPAQTAESQTFGMSNIGNTAGTSGVISGNQLQMLVVGGPNVTVSQSTNVSSATLSISVAAQTVESQSIGASNLGNTLGTSGVASGGQVRAVIIGTSNITVSQSVNGASATLSFIGQPAFSAGVSTAGNTAGSTGISGTRMVLVGTNNITLSQSTDANGNTISISGAGGGAGQFSAGVSTGGNTAGSTGITGTRLVLYGDHEMTLSQSTDANGATVSFINPSLFKAGVSTGGNTSGNTGTVVNNIIFAGINNITLSEATAGGTLAATVSISGPTLLSAGFSNLGNTSGTSGLASNQLVLVGTDTVDLSGSTNAGSMTISIGEGLTNSVWIPFNYGVPPTPGTISNATAHFAPVRVDRFHSASAAAIAFSLSGNNTGTMSATISFAMGIYTRNGSTLSAASISGTNYTISYTSTQSSVSYHGGRLITQSMNMNLTPGLYWLGIWYRTSGGGLTFTPYDFGLPVAAPTLSGVFSAASNASAQIALGWGELSATSTTLNNSAAFSDIRGTNASQMRIVYAEWYNVSA